MNKQQLIASIAEKSGLNLAQSERALNAFTESVKESVKSGNAVRVMNFGAFEKKVRRQRNGVSPKTRETIIIPAKDYVKFTPSKSLLD